MSESNEVEVLKAEIVRLRADRDSALASERQLWRAYLMAKGAAERCAGVLAMARIDDVDEVQEVSAQLENVNDDLRTAERLAGVAIEG